ncbi:MAG: hypothetical protein A2144_04045 [Chloroflexi bacterium RBG_16_50_9]|nr:MAG: hypothetical protein A2144_04045 [Chloroflexi bacterium RBG_16_50_9]
MSVKKVIIYVDGAARGNPGPAAIGATIRDERGNLISSISQRIGITTNNQAEYQAIITALKTAIGAGAKYVELKSDSELVVKQLKGIYRVKNLDLKALHEQVRQLIASLKDFSIIHIPREQNTGADKLANQALDLP